LCGCTAPGEPHNRDEALATLERALDAGDRRVIVVAHHPLATGGPHGGRCPRLNFSKPCWKPKFNTFTHQDTPTAANAAMRDALSAVLRKRRPMLYAAGHEHAIQLQDSTAVDAAATLHAVSGTGIYGHTSPVQCVPGGILATSDAGFMRVEVLRNGDARLTVLTVDADGKTTERSRVWFTGKAVRVEGRNCGNV
jgi:hypothetical protein